jgi:hypothetical protein
VPGDGFAVVPGHGFAVVPGHGLAAVLGRGLAGALVLAGTAWVAVGRTRSAVRERVDDGRFRWVRPARWLEAVLAVSGLSAARGPDEEVVVERLQRRYVADDLDERAFERELERLLGAGDRVRTGGEFRAASTPPRR